jgi:hypothetical protein
VISAKRLPPPDFYGRLESTHLGHLAIYKDETVVTARVPVESLPAVDCSFDYPTRALQYGSTGLEVNGTVFYQQHRRALSEPPTRFWIMREVPEPRR